eukprot:jgi/Chrzof1/2729/Cz11g27030.t1
MTGAMRFPTDMDMPDEFVGRPGVEAFLHRRGRGSKDKVYMAVKYFVDPGLQQDFVDAWLKMYDESRDEKGLNVIELTKTMHDNVLFTAYNEFESMDDFEEHLEEDHVQDFLDYLQDNDIIYTIVFLEKPQDMKDVVKKGDHGDEEQHLHVMVKYIVPPSEHEDFLEAWAEAQDMTAKEKGNRKYLLRKVFNDNVHYVLCGTWETFDDFVDHFKSKHIRRLRDFTADRKIIWYVAPMKKITSSKSLRAM